VGTVSGAYCLDRGSGQVIYSPHTSVSS
jgi:hypothetical protein